MTSNNKHRNPRSFFSNNLALKIISLIFAIILWSFVTNSTNPDRTKELKNIPVVIQGLEALEEKGYPVLIFKADPVDERKWNAETMGGLVDEFIETRVIPNKERKEKEK